MPNPALQRTRPATLADRQIYKYPAWRSGPLSLFVRFTNLDDPRFQPGFRFSVTDGIVLVGGAVASIVRSPTAAWLSFVVAFVVLHFFLFCNVFRLARPLELLWSAVFVVSTYFTVAHKNPSWTFTVTVSLVMTAIVIVVEMRKPSYHGVLWQTINPSLPQWWSAQTGVKT